jgi:hypothetical protein
MNLNRIEKPERASVLLLVLGTIYILSLVVTSFLEHIQEEVLYRDQQQAPVDLELEWESYQDLAIAILLETKKWDGELFSPEQGWNAPLRCAGFPKRKDLDIRIDIQDETGKLPCHQRHPLHQAWIARYVGNWSLERKVQEAWQSILREEPVALVKDSGGFETKNEKISLRDLDTLHSVDVFAEAFFDKRGWGNEMWSHFKSSLTSIAIGPININTASPDLRRQIAQKQSWDPGDFEAFFHQEDTFHMGNVERFFKTISSLGRHGFPLRQTQGLNVKCNVLNISIALERGEQCLKKCFWFAN